MVRVLPHLTRKSLALLGSVLLTLFWVPGLINSAHAASTSVDFSQCANNPTTPHDCTWINGNLQANNSEYAEGMSTLQRLVLSSIPSTVGNHHTLTFHTSFTKGGLHSYDFLTSWDQAATNAMNAASYYQVPFRNLNPCVGAAGTTCTTLAATTPTAVTVPDDPFVSHDGATQTRINAYEALFGDRTVSLYGNGAVSGATLALAHVDTGGTVANGADTGDTDIAWTLNWTGATTDLMLTFGAHVAKGVGLTGWGANTGASSISGAPYHVSMDLLDGASLGSQDNQMMGTTVPVPGVLTVTKVLSPASDPGRFDLQVAGTTYKTAAGNGDSTGQLTFPAGTYTVGEIANAANGANLSNYDTSTSCTDGTTGTGHSGVSVTLASEENVTCTITNTRSVGKIRVNKTISGDEVGTDPHFSFNVVCSDTAYNQTLNLDMTGITSSYVDSSNIPTGTTCTVSEGTHDGYTVTVAPADGSVTVPGHVDFTNTRDTGKITVNKTVSGDQVGTDPNFSFNVVCSDTAYNQTLNLDMTGKTSSSVQSSDIPTGMDCTVSEGTHDGYTVTVAPADGSVTVPGHVDFSNTRDTDVITVNKTLVGDPTAAQTAFTFHVDCPVDAYDQDITLDLSGKTSGSAQSGQIPTGMACTVTEGAHSGWTASSSPADGSVTVPGSVGFTNTRNTGVITVSKTTAGAVAGASTVFKFDVVCPSAPAYNQTLTIDTSSASTATSGQIPTGVACSVVEESTSGWQQTTPAQGGVDVTVPGSASFTNARLTGALQLAKSVTPASGSYSVGDPSNTLTYTLSLSPTGALDHTNVSVTDYIPGYDPSDTKSGKTTYVAGSATCSTGCAASYDAANHLLTWAVGNVAHDAAAVVMTFKVTINRPNFDPTVGLPVETIDNIGFVQSLQQGRTPSNQVKTPVSAVLGVKVVRPPKLAFTGLPAQELLALGLLMLGIGVGLTAVRRREQ